MPVFLVVAYGLGALGVIWFAADSGRIPSLVWFWSGSSRLGWWVTVLVGLVALGIPAFVIACAWRLSPTRRTLYRETDELRGGVEARRARLARSTRNVV